MSFADDVRQQLCYHDIKNICCAESELMALEMMLNRDGASDTRRVHISTAMQERIVALEKKAKKSSGSSSDKMDLARSCCASAYLRSCFIIAGSVNPPDKGAHMEVKFNSELAARLCADCAHLYEIEFKSMQRRMQTVLYLKKAQIISLFLAIIGAHKAMLEYENGIIVRNLRNDTNRAVNCDNANIEKASRAMESLLELIEKCQSMGLYSELPAQILEITDLCLKYPECSMTEIGNMLTPTLTKSGVNHRIRKFEAFCHQKKIF